MRFLSLRGSFARLRLPSDTSISHEAAFFLTAEEVPQSSLTRILLPLSALAMTFRSSVPHDLSFVPAVQTWLHLIRVDAFVPARLSSSIQGSREFDLLRATYADSRAWIWNDPPGVGYDSAANLLFGGDDVDDTNSSAILGADPMCIAL